ncbi:hypothetical protein SAMN05421664_3278 [Chryseobacterium soldanellicola]|uniref:Uncharacterized protein n=1 Tax=Chryseobacterium soldanellicola TaxID=311333 RepID=A0A1H1FUP7_9FLAO|nr:hypothetical protein [Chryseobacterium soldanellicola]SDR04717.1 hypothetical protein SAMN05421664_3278 [Chryseobacterium soldanellicola]
MEKNKPEYATSPFREIPDLISHEIKDLYGLEIPENKEDEKIVYIVHKSYFGIFRKEIHISLFSGRAIDYRIVYSILGLPLK